MPKKPPTLSSLRPKQPWSHQRTQEERHTYNTVYNTPRWRAVRDLIRERDPVCVMCRVEPTHTIDHIVPIREGGDVWNPANLQGLCKRCNASKTGKHKKSII